MTRGYTRWTPERVTKAEALLDTNHSIAGTAAQLGCTPKALECALNRNQVRPKNYPFRPASVWSGSMSALTRGRQLIYPARAERALEQLTSQQQDVVQMKQELQWFTVTGRRQGDTMQPIARCTCTKCTNTYDVAIKAGYKLNPEAIAQALRNQGWNCDGRRPSTVLCPDCKAARPANDPNSELKRMEQKMANNPVPSPAPAQTTVTVALREPTPDQRAEIRRLLEAHFDEDHGYYLDDYTDARIAEQLNLPRLVVERLREAAYGPIRVSPEQIAAQREGAKLVAKMNDLESSYRALMDQLKSDLAQMRVEVTELAAKVGLDTRVA